MEPAKNIVVTGGNRGIGYEVAKAFYLEGHNVIFGSRNEQKNYQAVKEITSKQGGNLKAHPLDLANRESVEKFAEAVQVLEPNLGRLLPRRHSGEQRWTNAEGKSH